MMRKRSCKFSTKVRRKKIKQKSKEEVVDELKDLPHMPPLLQKHIMTYMNASVSNRICIDWNIHMANNYSKLKPEKIQNVYFEGYRSDPKVLMKLRLEDETVKVTNIKISDDVMRILWRIEPKLLVFDIITSYVMRKLMDTIPDWWFSSLTSDTRIQFNECDMNCCYTEMMRKMPNVSHVSVYAKRFDASHTHKYTQIVKKIIIGMHSVEKLIVFCKVNLDEILLELCARSSQYIKGISILEFLSSPCQLSTLITFVETGKFASKIRFFLDDIIGPLNVFMEWISDVRKIPSENKPKESRKGIETFYDKATKLVEDNDGNQINSNVYICTFFYRGTHFDFKISLKEG